MLKTWEDFFNHWIIICNLNSMRLFLKDDEFFTSDISIYIIVFYFWVLSAESFLNDYIISLKNYD